MTVLTVPIAHAKGHNAAAVPQIDTSGDTAAGVHQQPLFAALRSQVIPMHGPPFGPVKPALQMHCVTAVELAGELDPPGQAVGAEAPALGQYVPTGHAVEGEQVGGQNVTGTAQSSAP